MYQPQPTPHSPYEYGNYAFHPGVQAEIESASRNISSTHTGLHVYGDLGCGSNNGEDFPFEGAFGVGSTDGGPSGATPQFLLRSTLNPPNPRHFHRSSFHANSDDTNSAHQTGHPPTHRSLWQPVFNMEGYEFTDDMLAQDLAAQEEAARQYQPQLEGPLVGDKVSSQAITEEYAKADPAFVTKTSNLPKTYSHYRQIQGDGNCGWRAIVFSYFEALLQSASPEVIVSERNRLHNYPIKGPDPYIYEDMQSEFVQIFDAILQLIPFPDGRTDAVSMLVHRFNDPENANNLLYYARLLASSWLKSGAPEAQDYVPFLLDMGGIDGYCDNVINIPNREIEEVGLRILWNVLLRPTNMVLEIAYLDRSVGEEVNTYRIPDAASGQDPSTLGPLICLLFRPDHYDILYRHPGSALASDHPSAEAAGPVDLQVNRVAHLSYDHQNTAHTTLQDYYQGGADNVLLSLIPGLGHAGSAAATVPAFWDVAGSHMSPYTPSSQPSWTPSPFNNELSVPLRQTTEQPHLDGAQLAPAEPVSTAPPSATATTPPFRLSEHCYHQVNSQGLDKEGWQEPTFSTATFKNSCFNTAHFQNPNFHPEEYHPDQEEDDHEVTKAPRARKGRGT